MSNKAALDDKNTPLSLMHDFSGNNSMLFTRKVLIILIVAAFLGIISGYLIAGSSKNPGNKGIIGKIANKTSIPAGTTFGSDDLKTYKDSTEGILKEGGTAGEGEYHLVRPGGDSQNVYLTSSLVDLSRLIDRKIKVWGQTQTAQTAGWFMDVGRAEVLE